MSLEQRKGNIPFMDPATSKLAFPIQKGWSVGVVGPNP
jgi:hypothetical protein